MEVKKIIIILISLLDLCSNICSSSICDTISQIEKEFSIRIIYNELDSDKLFQITYENCNDTIATLNYLNLLHHEYSKYPLDYFQLIGIKKIVLCNKLKLADQYRAAIPDPYSNSLFLSIDGYKGYNRTEYLIHVMHHELNHCAEYVIWGDMHYKWRKWKRTNRVFFKYKGDGSMAYNDNTVDWYSMTHPKKGFINFYSMTAQEEDRSEIIALIMSDMERKYIYQYYDKDRVLRKKIKLILTKLNDYSKTDKNYWQNSLDTLVKKNE
jgi:hypothetical protein